MSYYSVINNTFNEELYISSQRKRSGDIYKLPITNWVFFIPVVYLIIVLIVGIIYTSSRDQGDFKIMNSYEEPNSQN